MFDHSYVVTKTRYKFVYLQVYCHLNTSNTEKVLWKNIPKHFEKDMLKKLYKANVRVTGSVNKYLDK